MCFPIIKGIVRPLPGGEQMSSSMPGISFQLQSNRVYIFHSTILALDEPKYIRLLFNPEKSTWQCKRAPGVSRRVLWFPGMNRKLGPSRFQVFPCPKCCPNAVHGREIKHIVFMGNSIRTITWLNLIWPRQSFTRKNKR